MLPQVIHVLAGCVLYRSPEEKKKAEKPEDRQKRMERVGMLNGMVVLMQDYVELYMMLNRRMYMSHHTDKMVDVSC